MRLLKLPFRHSVQGLIILLISYQCANAQSFNLDENTSFVQINGTSSLHDWHCDVEDSSGTLKLTDSQQIEIESLTVSFLSESIKSGKTSMDKNTYKALKTDTFKSIDFNLKRIEAIKKIGNSSYQVHAIGNLSMTGNTKSVDLHFKLTKHDDYLTVEGKKTLLMTDFGISPPKALLGTIKTGNEITIDFKTVFK